MERTDSYSCLRKLEPLVTLLLVARESLWLKRCQGHLFPAPACSSSDFVDISIPGAEAEVGPLDFLYGPSGDPNKAKAKGSTGGDISTSTAAGTGGTADSPNKQDVTSTSGAFGNGSFNATTGPNLSSLVSAAGFTDGAATANTLLKNAPLGAPTTPGTRTPNGAATASVKFDSESDAENSFSVVSGTGGGAGEAAASNVVAPTVETDQFFLENSAAAGAVFTNGFVATIDLVAKDPVAAKGDSTISVLQPRLSIARPVLLRLRVAQSPYLVSAAARKLLLT